MEELKTYLSELSEAERNTLATKCGFSLGHIKNVSYGCKPCDHKLAAALEKHSKRRVTRQSLCPTDWHVVWPELAKRKAKQSPVSIEAAQ